MALDCEMDLNTTNMTEEDLKELNENQCMCNGKNPGLPLKVSLVNQAGEVVLDTLVDYTRCQVFTIPKEEEMESQTQK
jgi:hypothetical protein